MTKSENEINFSIEDTIKTNKQGKKTPGISFQRLLKKGTTREKLSDMEAATMYKKIRVECKIVWKFTK